MFHYFFRMVALLVTEPNTILVNTVVNDCPEAFMSSRQSKPVAWWNHGNGAFPRCLFTQATFKKPVQDHTLQKVGTCSTWQVSSTFSHFWSWVTNLNSCCSQVSTNLYPHQAWKLPSLKLIQCPSFFPPKKMGRILPPKRKDRKKPPSIFSKRTLSFREG